MKKIALYMVAAAILAVFVDCTIEVGDEPGADQVGDVQQGLTDGNGYTYPLASMSSWTAGHNYGACGSYYQTDRCHIGNDISASAGTTVSAIAAGTVIYVSGSQNSTCTSGWGKDWLKSTGAGTQTCNVAVLVQHYDHSGNPFVVLYGHLRSTTTPTQGSTVSAGQTMGQVAYYWVSDATSPYQGGTHLHFGIFPGTSYPTSGMGKVYCSGLNQPAVNTLPAFPPPCVGRENGSAPPTYMTAPGR